MSDDQQAAFAEAVQRHQAGELDAAGEAYRRITAADPQHADALHFLGVISLQKNEPNDAVGLIRQAIAIRPDQSEFHMHLGLCLHAQEQFAECEESLRRAVELAGNHPDARFNLGQFLMMTERETEAEIHIRKALELAPQDPRYLNALGTLMIAQDQYTEAKSSFSKAVEAAPGFLLARLNLVQCLIETGDLETAEGEARRCCGDYPDDVEARDLLAQVLRTQSRYDESIDLYRSVLNENPDDIAANLGLGSSLLAAERVDEAVNQYRTLLESHPDGAEYHYNLGLALRAQGADDEAIDCFNQAIGLAPEYVPPLYMRAMTELANGNFEDGLPAYEMRWADPRHTGAWVELPQASWNGEDLVGKKLLVWGEQSIGDHVLYAGLLPTLQARGADCIWECDPRLLPIMQRSFPEVEMVGIERPANARLAEGDIDLQVPMASTMYNLAPWPVGFKPAERYLKPAPDRVAEFQSRLDQLGSQPKIGIAWQNTMAGVISRSSCPLRDWGAILTDRDAIFVNLQMGDLQSEVQEAADTFGTNIHTDPDLDWTNDIDGLLALIDTLDLVVTTSNVTAHLAGALGKPTLLLLHYRSGWYWGVGGETILFYPSVRAYRQPQTGVWGPAVEEIGSRLTGMLKSGNLSG